jgi:thioredoxin 1
MSAIPLLTAHSFSDALASGAPLLVDFGADWCEPCRMLEPILEQLALAYAGRLTVARLDADRDNALFVRYGVMGMPTLILFQRGQPTLRLTGYRPGAAIAKALDSQLD